MRRILRTPSYRVAHVASVGASTYRTAPWNPGSLARARETRRQPPPSPRRSARSRKQTVKLTYSLSYLRLVNRRRGACGKAGKLSKRRDDGALNELGRLPAQHLIIGPGLKQTTPPLIGPSRMEPPWGMHASPLLPPAHPTSAVVSRWLDRQRRDRLLCHGGFARICHSLALCRVLRLSHRTLPCSRYNW